MRWLTNCLPCVCVASLPLLVHSLAPPRGGRFSTANPKSDVEWQIYTKSLVSLRLPLIPAQQKPSM